MSKKTGKNNISGKDSENIKEGNGIQKLKIMK